MRSSENRATVTVTILTYNGDRYLDEILSSVEGQNFDGEVEILVIDSGSTDKTVEIVKSHPTARLHQIPNSEFGHGKTRNLAAKLAQGEFIVFLTHDAIPSNNRWLYELLAPLRIPGADIKAVMGKQIPRSGCFPLLKYEISAVFAGFGPDFGTTFFVNGDFAKEQGIKDALAFYSDVNSATRTEFILNEIPYRDVRYSEDMLFGHDLIEAGYRKAYSPRGSVVHSNDLKLNEYGRRIFDETVGLRQIGKRIPPMSRRAQLRATIRSLCSDSFRIIRDSDYKWFQKIYWLTLNPLYHIIKWRFYRLSTLIDLSDTVSIQARSLEHGRKKN